MKFALIGAHSAGKTTCVSYVLQHLKSVGIEDVLIREENARMCPYPINLVTNFKGHAWILTELIRAELELEKKCSYMICDRSAIDQVVYADEGRRRGRITAQEFRWIRNTAIEWLRTRPYDVIYLMEPLELKEDSMRPKSLKWHKDIARLFEAWVPYLTPRGYIRMGGEMRIRKQVLATDVEAKIRNPPCSVMGRTF